MSWGKRITCRCGANSLSEQAFYHLDIKEKRKWLEQVKDCPGCAALPPPEPKPKRRRFKS